MMDIDDILLEIEDRWTNRERKEILVKYTRDCQIAAVEKTLKSVRQAVEVMEIQEKERKLPITYAHAWNDAVEDVLIRLRTKLTPKSILEGE